MGINLAKLAAGSLEINPEDTQNHTVIAQIRTTTEDDITAVVKDLSARQLANELIAASIISKLQLPSPRSFLVFADPEDAFGDCQVRHENGDYVYFGSELSNDKPFHAFFGYHDIIALRTISEFADWGSILAVDEWTANVDRHLGNFLFDGSTVYLFDHDQCLTGGSWTPADLKDDLSYECHEAVDAIHAAMTPEYRRSAKALADKLSTRASAIKLDEAIKESYASEVGGDVPPDIPHAENFLRGRVRSIPLLCEQRLLTGGSF